MTSDIVSITTDNQVGLPLDLKTFSEVILDFLGRKENLSYHDENNFILKLDDILQFDYILKQKISYQKNVLLDHFSIIINYSDDSSREINGEEALKSFVETRSVGVVSLHLNWKVIIKFDNNPTIETQEISLLFDVKSNQYKYYRNIFTSSKILISINHTNQSWALDILHAFKDRINHIVIKETKAHKNFKRIKNSDLFSLVLLFSTLVLCILLSISLITSEKTLKNELINYSLKQNYKDETSKIMSLLTVSSLDTDQIKALKKSNKEISNIIHERNKENLFLLLLISAVITAPFLLMKYINYSINYFNHKSFIVIGGDANKILSDYKDTKNRATYFSISLITTSILFSILATVIYNFISALFV